MTLREEREPYSANFAPESEALRPENTILWDEKLRSLRHSVVRPGRSQARRSLRAPHIVGEHRLLGGASVIQPVKVHSHTHSRNAPFKPYLITSTCDFQSNRVLPIEYEINQ